MFLAYKTCPACLYCTRKKRDILGGKGIFCIALRDFYLIGPGNTGLRSHLHWQTAKSRQLTKSLSYPILTVPAKMLSVRRNNRRKFTRMRLITFPVPNLHIRKRECSMHTHRRTKCNTDSNSVPFQKPNRSPLLNQ